MAATGSLPTWARQQWTADKIVGDRANAVADQLASVLRDATLVDDADRAAAEVALAEHDALVAARSR